MPRKSIKENKSEYQLAREKLGLTREQASDCMKDMVSAEKIEKIENGKLQVIDPEDIIQMATCYKKPELLNYYCTHECAIGKQIMPYLESKEIAQITLETINSLNQLNKEKERFMEIIEDGKINEDELEDFKRIRANLEKISTSIMSFHLWLDKAILQGEIEQDARK